MVLMDELFLTVNFLMFAISSLMAKLVARTTPVTNMAADQAYLAHLWLEELKGDTDELFLSDGLKNGFQLGLGFSQLK